MLEVRCRRFDRAGSDRTAVLLKRFGEDRDALLKWLRGDITAHGARQDEAA